MLCYTISHHHIFASTSRFFLVEDKDFFKEGMYTAIPSRERGSTTTNNIWISKSKDKNKNRDVRVTSLAFFQPKKGVKDICVTLREWAAFIFKCEFEPKLGAVFIKKVL
jgi:hypothetical protein